MKLKELFSKRRKLAKFEDEFREYLGNEKIDGPALDIIDKYYSMDSLKLVVIDTHTGECAEVTPKVIPSSYNETVKLYTKIIYALFPRVYPNICVIAFYDALKRFCKRKGIESDFAYTIGGRKQ